MLRKVQVMESQVLKYEGCNFLRQRLVLSTLSSRPVRITNIREDADEPGLRGQLLLSLNTLPSQICSDQHSIIIHVLT